MIARIFSIAKQFLLLLTILTIAPESRGDAPSTYVNNVRFMRGRGTDLGYYSMVVPLSGQQVAPIAFAIATNYYHLNGTNSGNSDFITNRFVFSSVLASFGSQL